MSDRHWQQTTVNKWFADDGNVVHRLSHDIGPDGLILDVGGFTGEGTQRLYDRYGCNIHVFEPLKEHYENLKARFEGVDKVTPLFFGLSNESTFLTMTKRGDASTTLDGDENFLDGDDKEAIEVMSADSFFKAFHINKVDLMEINIEGGEYELLPHMLDKNLVRRVDNLQIQFHDVLPDAYDRMVEIQDRLSETHELTYQYNFVFENWKRK